MFITRGWFENLRLSSCKYMPNDWWNVFAGHTLWPLWFCTVGSRKALQGTTMLSMFKHSGLIGWYWEVPLIFQKQTTMQNRLSAQVHVSNFQSSWTPWYMSHVHRHCNWETCKIMDGSKFKQNLPGTSPFPMHRLAVLMIVLCFCSNPTDWVCNIP